MSEKEPKVTLELKVTLLSVSFARSWRTCTLLSIICAFVTESLSLSAFLYIMYMHVHICESVSAYAHVHICESVCLCLCARAKL